MRACVCLNGLMELWKWARLASENAGVDGGRSLKVSLSNASCFSITAVTTVGGMTFVNDSRQLINCISELDSLILEAKIQVSSEQQAERKNISDDA